MAESRSSDEAIRTQCLFFSSLGSHSHIDQLLKVKRWLQPHQLYILIMPSPIEKRAFFPQQFEQKVLGLIPAPID